MKTQGFRCLFAFIVGSLALMSVAQEPSVPTNSVPSNSLSAGGEAATGTGVEAKTPRASSTRRLPRYFASVVDAKQRMAIYEIQSQYRAKVEQLEHQLAELRLAEMNDIEKVLSETQRMRVEELRLSAAARTKELVSPKDEGLPVAEGASGGSPPKSSDN